jgi:hypothetical protein
MKRQLYILTAMLGLLGVLAITPVYANGNQIQVTIPFQFMVENQVLPAGHYLIQSMDVYDPCMMVIRNTKTNQECVFLTERADRLPSQKTTDVLFHQTKGQEHLTRIWINGNDYDLRVIPAQPSRGPWWLLTETFWHLQPSQNPMHPVRRA